MIQPPLLGVVNAASAVSVRTLTCRAPAVPRSISYSASTMKAREGDIVELRTPAGIEHIEVLEIRYSGYDGSQQH